jgi:hypothetical protein
MLPSRPSSLTKTNIFGEIWTTHKSLGSSSTSSKGQTPSFHTPKFVQGLETNLDEHMRIATMFQQVAVYNVQITNILFKLYNLEIKNKQAIKDIYVQNL